MRSLRSYTFLLVTFLLFTTAQAFSQVMEGELRVSVRDPDGRPAQARIEIVGRNPEFRAVAETDPAGQARIQRLPPGVYSLTVERTGFARYEETVEIRSAVPQQRDVALKVGTVATEVTVTDAAPLLDSGQPAQVLQAGR